jgi:3-oxoacyl-[acyl-carrier protein] reductase
MELGLTGKAALVTGGSKGIGRAIVIALAGEGARVAAVARNAGALAAVAAEVRAKTGGELLTLAADLNALAEITRVVDTTRRAFGRIDILVNNAGAIRPGNFLTIPDEQWTADWNLKLLGYIRAARAVLPIMIEQRGGRIVNVIGAAARNPSPTYLVGGAANAALVNFTKGLADLGAPSNVLVTAVSPAAVRTERWESMLTRHAEAAGRPVDELRAESERAYPLGRVGEPDDVASLVCFLASERAAFLTGICVTVDGGWTRGVSL